MNTKQLLFYRKRSRANFSDIALEWFKPVHLLAGLLLVWFTYPLLLNGNDPTLGYIEQSIWLLLVLSLITFLLVAGLCWWLLGHFWIIAGLPDINSLIIKFKDLSTWQQFSLLYASFIALLLAAVTCIGAIC